MVVIGYDKILELIEKEKLIENVDKNNVQPSGVDLRVKKVYRLKNGGYLGVNNRQMPNVDIVSDKVGDKITLNPNEFVLVETMEKVNMPKNLLALILPRSSLFRCGVSLHTAVVDPGFIGT